MRCGKPPRGAGSLRAVREASAQRGKPAVALLAGIAVHPQARGQGLGRDIAGFLLAEALHRHEAAALMVEDGNHAARHLYRSLGLRYQPVAAAAVIG
jgi:ribosomal protein S18 acetylase RimI-like enzyme